ncbi:MAG: hypothetical protein ABFS39_14725 [Pseudomonadota bacterium]
MQIRIFVLLIACVFQVGCVFYPRQVQQYDADCEIKYKKLILEHNELRGIRINCTNEGCLAALLLIPIEAIVAGSIVVVGNTVYWLEKEGRCLLKSNE